MISDGHFPGLFPRNYPGTKMGIFNTLLSSKIAIKREI